jgi:murein L,D-transpeptidase YcbB/YkuD
MKYCFRLSGNCFFAFVKMLPLFLLLALTSCSHLWESTATLSEPKHDILIDTSLISNAHLIMPASTQAVYASRSYNALWIDTAVLSVKGYSLFNIIVHAERYGLNPDDYHANELRQLFSDSTAKSLAQADLYLTDGYFAIRAHLKSGRIDPVSHLYRDDRQVIDTAGIELLRKAGNINLTHEFQMLEPRHEQYIMLKDSLQKILALGIADSGALSEIALIKLNMERWRLHKDFPSRFLRVNVPAFRFDVREGDSIALTSNVIVGKPETKTPLLESTITSFVIYPYWHVPRGIAVNEILPSIQSDSSYLAKHNYDVLDKFGNVVDQSTIVWNDLHVNYFPYVLRQRDGAENTLGIIKFLFKNSFNVYLHDTNGRRLFSRSRRALSHGCVRVQKAKELARYLVKDDSIYVTPEDLDQYLSLKQRYQVNVVRPIPLYIEYFTCEVHDGKLSFYEDIYGLDELLQEVLDRKSSEGPVSNTKI